MPKQQVVLICYPTKEGGAKDNRIFARMPDNEDEFNGAVLDYLKQAQEREGAQVFVGEIVGEVKLQPQWKIEPMGTGRGEVVQMGRDKPIPTPPARHGGDGEEEEAARGEGRHTPNRYEQAGVTRRMDHHVIDPIPVDRSKPLIEQLNEVLPLIRPMTPQEEQEDDRDAKEAAERRRAG